MTPNTAERFSSHIPALATLVSLGWRYMSPAECLDDRGGNQAVILRSVLVAELRRRTFDYKGKTYPLSTNAIDQIVRDLSAPALNASILSSSSPKAVNIRIGTSRLLSLNRRQSSSPLI